MKSSCIILFFSINLIASLTPSPNIFDLIQTQQDEGQLEQMLSSDTTLCLSRNKKGQTPLIAAIVAQNRKSAELIIKYMDETSINIQDVEGNSALHHAFIHNVPIGLFLIIKGAKIDLPNQRKETAIHLAVTDEEKFTSITFALCQSPQTDLGAQDEDGNTPLHIAVKYSQKYIIKALVLTFKAPINIQNKHKLTPLHIGIIQRYVPSCLFNDQTDYNIQDNCGYTALHLAVLFHDKNSFPLESLVDQLSQNTNKNLKTFALKDKMGKITCKERTAYQLAKKFNKNDLNIYLKTEEK